MTITSSIGVISAADSREQTSNYGGNSNSVMSSNTGTTYEGLSTENTTQIKVLIYNGEYSIGVCVTGIKKGLDSANAKNLVPGYHFTYATSTTITSAKLAGYDVLAMPGGADGDYYVYSGSISSSAIKKFVSSGHGYLGICAGAYSGVKAVKGYYNAWGVAPHVLATRPWVEGNVPMKIEPAGQALFGYGGNITIAHYNGPAMYASGGDIVTFATYADNSCKSKGLGAIVGDFYGNGRSVIVGPHPELDPVHPDMLANLVIWAANKSGLQSKQIYKASLAQIGTAASMVKANYNTSNTIPTKVTVDSYEFTMPQLLYLMGTALGKINSGYTSNITIRPIGYSTSPSGTYKSGSVKKALYLEYAKSLVSFINSNGRVPNFQTTVLGKMNTTKLVVMYSKIIYYYSKYGSLPSYVGM